MMEPQDPVNELASALKQLRARLDEFEVRGPDVNLLVRGMETIRRASRHFESSFGATIEERISVPEGRRIPRLADIYPQFFPQNLTEVVAVSVELSGSGLRFKALVYSGVAITWRDVEKCPLILAEYADLYAQAVSRIAERVKLVSERAKKLIEGLGSCLLEAARPYAPELLADKLSEPASPEEGSHAGGSLP